MPADDPALRNLVRSRLRTHRLSLTPLTVDDAAAMSEVLADPSMHRYTFDVAPSVEELAAAVADAECRETSGLSAAKYEKTWEEQQRLVTENRDKLDRIRSEATERKSKLLTIVAENAPAAP